ncbi:MAG: hypothetical protein GVY22_17160 [Gammaproteobacteria bacterium]|jgi:hypothetical protein|nr:hypothetical protein [Gammaproteobacteria bacterium]
MVVVPDPTADEQPIGHLGMPQRRHQGLLLGQRVQQSIGQPALRCIGALDDPG